MTLTFQQSRQVTQPEIAPLTVADLRELRLRKNFRKHTGELQQVISENPGQSFWVPSTEEFIVVGSFRNREDIRNIHAISALGNETRLIEAALEHATEHGFALMTIVDAEELRRPVFYENNGFRGIDHIATYELTNFTSSLPEQQTPDVVFQRVYAGESTQIAAVVQLDHLAFPWFWQNSQQEFAQYIELPGVELWLGYWNGRLVTYFGITHYPGWGHLDRIATVPDMQGTGIGSASLEESIRVLRAGGARRVELSTQGQNAQARRLYDRRGFARTPDHDYTVYGRVLNRDGMGSIQSESAVGARHRRERNH